MIPRPPFDALSSRANCIILLKMMAKVCQAEGVPIICDAGSPKSDISPAAAEKAAHKLQLNKRYFTSTGGILTDIALFSGIVATFSFELEKLETNPRFRWELYEYAVLASWLYLAVFVAFVGFSAHKKLRIGECAMNFIVTGQSIVLSLLISCLTFALTLGSVQNPDPGFSVAPRAASCAFAFLESLALFFTAAVTYLHMTKRYHAPAFD
ncbi:uncharacterized protein LOC129594502 [Paramacrobiotus metropolitanus]|uniref:uncharacterized protein LOC129594502 n=1 Tax=Paramacrobiotus metropolitanus TaxID=2943436 RepID=UPI00244592CE|nr:uncharacterized protein LOC129594502 [Paramacrobiotus metropolitanus]